MQPPTLPPADRVLRATVSDPDKVAGVCDYIDPNAGFRGWLVLPGAPGICLRLEAWCAGARLAQSTAILDRPDIDRALGRRSWCGYLLGWSRFDRAALAHIAERWPDALVELRTAGAGLQLPFTIAPLTAAQVLAMIQTARDGEARAEFKDLAPWHEIEASGLFDPYWYVRQYGEDTEANRPALLHYIQVGEAEGRRPNLYFDPEAYAAQAGLAPGQPRLLHHLRQPETRVSPHFDPQWYRLTHVPPIATRALAHYLAHRRRALPNPIVTAEMLADDPASPDRYEDLLRQMPPALALTPEGAEILADAQRLFAVQRDPLADLRALEAALQARDLPGATRIAERLRKDPQGWTRIALARLALMQQDKREASALLRGVTGEAPLRTAAAGLLLDCDDLEGTALVLDGLRAEASPSLDRVRIRLAVRLRDHAGLAQALRQADLPKLEVGVLCEAAYKLVRPGMPPEPGEAEAEALLDAALSLSSAENPYALQARLHMRLQRRRLDDLAALLTEAEAQPVAAKLNLASRRLEMLFLSGRLAEALALYRDKLVGTRLDAADGIIALRLLSEAKAWDEAGAVILSHLAQGHGFGETVFHAMRALRKAGLHDRVLAVAAPMGPDHDKFIDLVRLDRALIASAKGQAPQADGLHWLTGAGTPDPGGVIYLCADRRYFLSLLTCLASVFGQPVQSGAPVFVFLDSDVPPDWPQALQTLARRFGREVQVIAEADFVPQGVALKVELGFFAAGTGLSRAAYFRLYAARWLMALNRFSRALYIDTDIICRGDLSPLLALDLGSAPLAARVEDQGPEVMAAAEKNGIEPSRYFNSGVLAMDFAHPDLGLGIARAIALSEHEPDRLVFHDQCALNIAFRAAELAPQWNFFLRPFRPQNGQVQDGILLHYLDRPKPWDITFWRNFREEWRVWALVLAQILPPQAFTDMLAAANEV